MSRAVYVTQGPGSDASRRYAVEKKSVHELSIALKLVDLACEHARDYADAEVAAIQIAIGPLTQIHESALHSGFEIARQGTAVANARLLIRTLPLVVACTDCDREFEADGIQDLRCPACGGCRTRVACGDQLDLESITLLPRSEGAFTSPRSSSPQG